MKEEYEIRCVRLSDPIKVNNYKDAELQAESLFMETGVDVKLYKIEEDGSKHIKAHFKRFQKG